MATFGEDISDTWVIVGSVGASETGAAGAAAAGDDDGSG